MQQHQDRSLSQRFQQYRASKTVLFWACAGTAIVATVVGFTWGGWVTGGTARDMAEQSAAQARQELVAVMCVDRFMAAPGAGDQLVALQEITSAYSQAKFVEDGGWAVIPVGSGAEASMSVSSGDHRKAAGLCAAELAKREIPTTTGTATPINDQPAVVQ
jgi:hypothetical protein